jgi:hypothetical protein
VAGDRHEGSEWSARARTQAGVEPAPVNRNGLDRIATGVSRGRDGASARGIPRPRVCEVDSRVDGCACSRLRRRPNSSRSRASHRSRLGKTNPCRRKWPSPGTAGTSSARDGHATPTRRPGRRRSVVFDDVSPLIRAQKVAAWRDGSPPGAGIRTR